MKVFFLELRVCVILLFGKNTFYPGCRPDNASNATKLSHKLEPRAMGSKTRIADHGGFTVPGNALRTLVMERIIIRMHI